MKRRKRGQYMERENQIDEDFVSFSFSFFSFNKGEI